jgi:hypothetical protein
VILYARQSQPVHIRRERRRLIAIVIEAEVPSGEDGVTRHSAFKVD